MYRDTIAEQIPEADYCDYLFDLLNKVGVCGSGMAGPAPLSWGELNDWCLGNGVELYPTEKQTIIRLSEVYVSHLSKSEDPNELPPAAVDGEGENMEIDYGYLGQLHIGQRDNRRKREQEKKAGM